MQLYLTITAKAGERVPMVLDSGAPVTPRQLRAKVSETTRIPLNDLRLIFRGRMIKDDDSIADAAKEFKLENDSVLHCMGKPVADTESHGSNSSSVSVGANAASTAAPSSAPASRVPPLSVPVATTAAAIPSAGASAAGNASASSTSSNGNNNGNGSNGADPLSLALERLRTHNLPSVYATAVATLDKVLANIVAHPMEEKYRTVKRANPAFRKRLGGCTGGHDCMLACGFGVETNESGDAVYKLHASAEKWNALVGAREVVAEAVAACGAERERARQQQQRQQRVAGGGFGSDAAAAATTTNHGMGSGPGGFPSASLNDPTLQSAMSQMMSNPEALRQTLQNPMVQEMMRNDPNVSPMMRQYLEQIANNPAMLEQMAQRMQDPTVRDQLRRAMEAGGGGMGMGMGMGMGVNPNGNAATASPNAGAAAPPPPPPQNDTSQTEEEMIAEAIRRSLQDN